MFWFAFRHIDFHDHSKSSASLGLYLRRGVLDRVLVISYRHVCWRIYERVICTTVGMNRGKILCHQSKHLLSFPLNVAHSYLASLHRCVTRAKSLHLASIATLIERCHLILLFPLKSIPNRPFECTFKTRRFSNPGF